MSYRHHRAIDQAIVELGVDYISRSSRQLLSEDSRRYLGHRQDIPATSYLLPSPPTGLQRRGGERVRAVHVVLKLYLDRCSTREYVVECTDSV